MAIDKHGLTITGLKKCSGNTSDTGFYSASYSEIFYDRDNGATWAKYQYDFGRNTETVYHGNVIKICNTSKHLTMQEIADAIHQKLQEIEAMEEWGKVAQ
jgi:hypothetical protein